MTRVWITPTSEGWAGMDQGMASYSGSCSPFRLTQPYTTPSSSPTHRVPASRAASAVSRVGYFPRCQLV